MRIPADENACAMVVIGTTAAITVASPVIYQINSGSSSAERAVTIAFAGASEPEAVRSLGALGSEILLPNAASDPEDVTRFLEAWAKSHGIVRAGDAKAFLGVGSHGWTLPIPIVKTAAGWRFDTAAAPEEMRVRRIGRNELAAIEVARAYVDAQREYALTQGSSNGLHEYATKLVSTPGKKDGLYWRTQAGEPLSPLGPLAAKARQEGYGKRSNAANEPYHGYYYRILSRQGSAAPDGAYHYVIDGKMVAGFALVAYPARWGASGVMTFIVNHDGKVFQKDLGPNTATLAKSMKEYNPDKTWTEARP